MADAEAAAAVSFTVAPACSTFTFTGSVAVNGANAAKGGDAAKGEDAAKRGDAAKGELLPAGAPSCAPLRPLVTRSEGS